ncbi:MAG: flagellar hook-associated protein FlgL [Gammaproteobacteria bacterium]|nr:flagellar hook-associated protein FlgL [Gammaproteobacteria bacterium]
MRVSSSQFQNTAVEAMVDQHAKLSQVQQQVATGRRIVRPSDDPVAASKVVKMDDVIRNVEQFQHNISTARARLTMEDGVLENVINAYQRIRELTIQANNDSQTDDTRGYIAEEMSQLLDEVVGLANSTDSNGEFIFAGNMGRFKPFAYNDQGGFDYHGDDGQRFIQIGPRRQIAVNDSGSDVFREIRDGIGKFSVYESPTNQGDAVIDPGVALADYKGGTYAIIFDRKPSVDPKEPITYSVVDAQGNAVVAPGQVYTEDATIQFNGVQTFIRGEPKAGDYFVIRPSYHQDAFTTIKQYIGELKSSHGSPAEHAVLHNHTNQFLNGLDRAMGRVLDIRANLGARLNAMDSQEGINDALRIQMKEILSEVQDLDYGEAVSRLNLKLTGLEASQKAFTRVQGISLFNYL